MFEEPIDYVLISHKDRKQLAFYVKEKLKKHYKCLGGVFVVSGPVETTFYQTMILNKRQQYRNPDNFGNY